jgi:hypothetical protein
LKGTAPGADGDSQTRPRFADPLQISYG